MKAVWLGRVTVPALGAIATLVGLLAFVLHPERRTLLLSLLGPAILIAWYAIQPAGGCPNRRESE